VLLEQIDAAHVAAQTSSERCRLTSVILNTDVPLSAALVRKPLRRLWPLWAAISSPTRRAYRFTMREALSSARAASETCPPSAKARNTGPLLISARRQPRLDGRDRAEPVAARNRHLSPLPFLIKAH
jgi:hypothetical protein